MILAFALAAAVAPALLLVWFFRARDVHPEPARVIWATFGLGVACLLPAVAVAFPLAAVVARWSEPFSGGFLDALLCAALPEEACKLLVVWGYASRHRDFDEPMDGLVYGACASLGCSALENVMYVAEQPHLAILRALTAVPGHACMGAVMGFYVGQARMGPPERRREAWWCAYLFPVLLHTLYDFPLLTLRRISAAGEPSTAMAIVSILLALSAIGVLVFEIVWVLRLAGRLREGQLRRRAAAAAFATATATGAPALALGPAVAVAEPIFPTVGPAVATVVPSVVSALGPAVAAPVYGVGPPSAATARAPASVAGWVLAIGGGVAATAGLFVVFAVVMGVFLDEGNMEVGAAIAGGLVLGLLPLAAGGAGFALGLRRLQRR